MMPAKVDIISFEGGIIDELVEPRMTVVNHGTGCRRLENVISLPQGPILRRPPSRYMGSTREHGAARLIKVVYDETYAYLCEFSDGYIRFFTDDGQIVSGADPYEIAGPYSATELSDLQVFNDAGTLYVWHPDHPPYRLVYSGETSWVIEAVPFEWGPFRDGNVTAVTVAASATTGDVTLTAVGADVFVTGDAGHVGALWLIGHRTGAQTLSHTFTGTATSATLSVPKGASWTIETQGSWDGSLALEKSYDAGANYEIVTVFEPAEDNALDAVGDEMFDDALYRVRMVTWIAGCQCKCTLNVKGHVAFGVVKITAVASTTVASATVVETLHSTDATVIWAEGAWSPYRGYPRAGGLLDNRLVSMATSDDPTTMWMSHTNDYTDMRTGAGAADALTFTFTTGKGYPFLWLVAEQYRFYVATPSAILEMQAADPRSALSATNKPEITRRIQFGSAAVAPVRAHGSMIVVDPTTRRPMHSQYDWEQDLLLTPDLAFLCPTLMEPGIKQIVFQPARVAIVWFLRTDGVLLGMTFEQRFRDNITAWHQHSTTGTIESIETLPGPDGEALWWVVARTIDGATQRHVERLDPLDLTPVRATAQHLDGYIPFSGGDALTVSAIAIADPSGIVTVTTTAAHGLSDGDRVRFSDVGGMTWLNGQAALIVAASSTDSFALKTLVGDYVDGGYLTPWTSGGSVQKVAITFSGLGHLEGLVVYAVADGRVEGPCTVSGAAVTLGHYANDVKIGRNVAWALQPLRLVLPLPSGSTRGRQMRVSGLWLSLYRSWGCRFGPDEDHLRTLHGFDDETAVNAAPALVTGDVYLQVEGGYTDDPTVVLVGNSPLPFCLRCMMLDTGIYGTRAT